MSPDVPDHLRELAQAVEDEQPDLRLFDLRPAYVRLTNENGDWQRGVPRVDAQGVIFDCPLCRNHPVLFWAPEVPLRPGRIVGPGRWHLRGGGFADLTLKGVTSDSVLLKSGCKAHFFVRRGGIQMC